MYLDSNLPVLQTKDNASVYQFCENLTDSGSAHFYKDFVRIMHTLSFGVESVKSNLMPMLSLKLKFIGFCPFGFTAKQGKYQQCKLC